MLRRLALFALLTGVGWSLVAASVAASGSDAPVVVIDVHNPIDQRLMDYLADVLRSTEAHLFVLQVDSPGMSSGDPAPLVAAIDAAGAPVVVWVGGAPAVAFGGAGTLLNVADLGAAAPTTRIGLLEPTVIRDDGTIPLRIDRAAPDEVARSALALADSVVEIEEPVAGFVDHVVPTVGQLIVGLDGTEIVKQSGVVYEIATALRETDADGQEFLVPSRDVRFLKPGLWDRFLRLAASPEPAFFFLVAGIALATFELYAAGVGVTAAVAAGSLFLAGYGLATLPMSWPAVAATLTGLGLYTWDFQRGRIGWRSIVGTGLLLFGGLTFTSARPQFGPAWWIVVIVVVGTALFYGVALTTIVRSRFSTPTIGREALLGRHGTAETDLTPSGVVVVDGARWRGRSHREAGIRAGDGVEVSSIDGIVLEVEPSADAVRE